MEGQLVREMEEADLVVFTGGEDVTPYLYGAKPHKATYYNYDRDEAEIDAFIDARKLNKKIIGICRGAQLLCVLAGGTLVQHQQHPFYHEVHTSEGEAIRVTSAHHQRMYPWGRRQPEFELLAWAENLSPFSHGSSPDDDMRGKPEAEICLFPTINSLAIQSHPEMVFPLLFPWEHRFIGYCRQLLDVHMAAEYASEEEAA